ncbi:glycosyltransferase family 4 protein [Paenibacillus sp. FSL L8-0436]|uniref:glycosyltransferase family 4 protein n=1 Tax=Paenibacillus sp. FSL L8-0436 TaxID=2954686 RepID=UPI00315975C8
MKKALILVSVASMIDQFNMLNIKVLQEMGCEIHVAANFHSGSTTSNERVNSFREKLDSLGIKVHHILINRSVLSKDNIRAYKEVKSLIERERFDVVHCHSPIGGVLVRLAARKKRDKTKVIYTAHGFHFFKGSSKLSWIAYYPIEKWLSRYTDCLITINKEDYKISNTYFSAKTSEFVNGIGIDLGRFKPQTIESKMEYREKYGFREEDFILIYAGELSSRKHQDLLIQTIHLLENKVPNIRLLLAGKGTEREKYESMVERLNLHDKVLFLGYREDINNLMLSSDVAVSSSRQEGLPVNVMEAMATALPLIVTDCRGNKDLVVNNLNGYVVGINDPNAFAGAIERLYSSMDLRREFGMQSQNLIKEYSNEVVRKQIEKIYMRYI